MHEILSQLISYLKENYQSCDTLLFPTALKKSSTVSPPEKKPTPKILLLTHPKEKEFLSFYESLIKAIDTTFAPSKIVDIHEEKNFLSASLSLILVSKSLFFQSPQLLSSYHRGTPPTLFGIPLILLPDLTLLSTQKEEKKNLWNLIQKELADKPCNLPQ